MNWTSTHDLRTQVLRWWERGELLRALAEPDSEIVFPRRLTLKGPRSSELAERFDSVRGWIAELSAMPQVRIEWREVNHRVLGAQRIPQSVWIDSPEHAITMIGKRKDAARFLELQHNTRRQQPTITPWLARYPLRALSLAGHWQALLAVVAWCQQHPRPGIYLRQIDIPATQGAGLGVHSKFIEAHKGVLTELLDLALCQDAIDTDYTGTSQFAARYGFADKPPRIRFRLLDENMKLLTGTHNPDITLDAKNFASLELPVRQVFITENEINFLSFPAVHNAIVIFGAGYGWEALAHAHWLKNCALHYWGDIDTHGFAILDQLRNRFDHVQSILMDRATLMAHADFWGVESQPTQHDLTRLTATELALYDDLRHHRIQERLRLEQERIGFRWVQQALDQPF